MACFTVKSLALFLLYEFVLSNKVSYFSLAVLITKQY